MCENVFDEVKSWYVQYCTVLQYLHIKYKGTAYGKSRGTCTVNGVVWRLDAESWRKWGCYDEKLF